MHKHIHNPGPSLRLLTLCCAVVVVLTARGFAQNPADTAIGLPYHNYDRPVSAETYLIRPQERLIVSFVGTKLAPLSLLVNADGKLVDPSLGVFSLAGKTLAEAREMISPSIGKAYTAEGFEITVSGPYRVAIAVTGAVRQPGIYLGYTSNCVSELLALAGGLLPTASRRHIEFLGGPADIPVDLDRAEFLGDWLADPCLYAGFRIHVPQRSDQTVHVLGEVVTPREIEYLTGDTVGSLLAFAGGLTVDADPAAITSAGAALGDRPLGRTVPPGTVITVPRKGLEAGSRGSVSLFGAVRTQGVFPMTNTQTLGGLLTQAGGPTEEANSARITVFRKIAREASRVTAEERFPILIWPVEIADSFVLKAGDSVFVPIAVGFVEVVGRVRFPGLFPYRADKDASYYIGLAGGYLADADRQDVDITDRISRQTHSGGPGSRIGDGDLVTVRAKETRP